MHRRDLIKPKNLVVERESLTDDYGKFHAEPLERGFGVTLGNALRRVLLGSLQGAAVSAVRIDGALHEFTAIADVQEDVADIILALKETLLKTSSSEPAKNDPPKQLPRAWIRSFSALLNCMTRMMPSRLSLLT